MGTLAGRDQIAADEDEREQHQDEIEWSEWGEYTALGSRRMDCIGRWESDRAHREIASQRHGR